MKKLIILALFISTCGVTKVAAQALTVESIKGDVYVSSDSKKWSHLHKKDQLFPGVKVKLGDESNATLTRENGVKLRLYANTELDVRPVTSKSKTDLKLHTGSLDVLNYHNDTPVLVYVPYGVTKCYQGVYAIGIVPASKPHARPAVSVKAMLGTALVAYQDGANTVTKEIHGKSLEPSPAQELAQQEEVAEPAPKMQYEAAQASKPEFEKETPLGTPTPVTITTDELPRVPVQQAEGAFRAEEQVFPDKLEKVDTEKNHFKLSIKQGLNTKATFSGIGGHYNASQPGLSGGKYDDGYVGVDSSGNAGNMTWNWGYNNASQVDSVNNTIAMNRATIGTSPSASQDFNTTGFELQFNRQLDNKEDWHYGLESAVNYTPMSQTSDTKANGILTHNQDLYGYTAGTTPPDAGYAGSANNAGFLINVPGAAQTPTTEAVTILSHDNFNANLFGIRLGPYISLPFGKKHEFNVNASGGLAAGVLALNYDWHQQVVNSSGNILGSTHGGGNDAALMYGYYLGLNLDYQIGKHWGVSGGVQYQDLGKYEHNFQGRNLSIDLSQSIYFLLGVTYSF